ncbi:kinase-like domain-containing protein [Mucor mucedo]|uniref:kinase-like domain-containing protein n=1 Tax=Mucor mucedo TaxID=29922 RepID=UPI002220DA12|nr:kinase-like domain-containing protein [Mucor mucedo]KAI7892455.1 kinase-like domain-containing protein [Mucor mucedo]
MVGEENDGKHLNTADELANLLVEQDNKRRSQLPSYPGLERFEITRKLGDGAFSNVYEARDTKTGKKVAIKVAQKSKSDKMDNGQRHLHKSIQKKPRATERANIIKEVQIMRNVRHANIVQLIHYTESGENYFLTLDLCQGGELFHQIVKLTYFSENLARHVITQVALAVRHLHEECGVVHRDIKPENILFDPIPIKPLKRPIYRPTDNMDTKEDEGEFIRGIGGGGIGTVKLADFGLSKVIWDNSTFTPCGTVGYTAPEIVCDQLYSKSVDMWAIGCVLYTILCGFPPFYDESIPILTEKVAKGQFTYLSPWWDTMSDSVKDLINHLLCVDSKKRYTIDQFLNHPWVTEEPFIRPHKDAVVLTEDQIQTKAYRHQQNVEQQELKAMVQKTVQSTLLTPPEIEQDGDDLMEDSMYSTPDAATLREIFDITYAVQRMGEEQSLMDQKQQIEQQQTIISPTPSPATTHVQVPLALQNQNLPIAQKLALHSRGVADPINYRHHQPLLHQQKPPNAFDGFQLDMNNATLLTNRMKIKV